MQIERASRLFARFRHRLKWSLKRSRTNVDCANGCATARAPQPRKGGLFEVRWNSGYEARGVFTAYSPPRALAFTWGSPYEPGETSVKVTLKPVEGGTKVTLTHSGFGTGKKWAGRAEEAEREWSGGLDNLKSTLETGLDLRQMNQPRLGLGWETAPGETGALVTAVIAGGPCDQAGLTRGDVIVKLCGPQGQERTRLAHDLLLMPCWAARAGRVFARGQAPQDDGRVGQAACTASAGRSCRPGRAGSPGARASHCRFANCCDDGG